MGIVDKTEEITAKIYSLEREIHELNQKKRMKSIII